MNKNLQEKIKLLPKNPGVYVMLGQSGEIIYVGKAKNLKNRVSQYFNAGVKNDKVMAMVASITDFYYIITGSEADALSLENNLIKKNKPKYNILLKDDKTYPYIKVDLKKPFPRFEIVRSIRRDGARYFGPFMAGINAKEILEIINSAFLLRSCSMQINEGSKKRECLQYHIKRCLGPCNGLCTRDEYMQKVHSAIDFLSGNDDEAQEILQKKMMQFSENEEFELALSYRDKIKSLSKIRERKITSLNRFISCDVISIASDNIHSTINVLITRGGRMQGGKYFAFEDGSVSLNDCLEDFLVRFYDKNNQLPDEIILNHELLDTSLLEEYFKSTYGKRVNISCAKQGVRKQLSDMATVNAKDYLEKSISKIKHKEDMTTSACERLKKLLNLKKYPKRMECYDISNISGVDKVGSMVVFIDGVKASEEYRRFRIKTVEGADDYASHQEMMTRRLQKLEEGDQKFPTPDLIIIDGGKGQLSAVKEIFDKFKIDIDLISLAEKQEEIFTLHSDNSIMLEKSDYCLQLLQRIRDEAHRFAITYHRTLRHKRSFYSELNQIPGIGKKKINALLERFGSVYEISNKSVEQLLSVEGIGEKHAKTIYDYFHKNSDIND
ncbi:MAG: excinuclease ABC subunit UvrC [Clostridia bacterium]|nr:excinuclease ABC subunit UvrC [Clostridia bacterium]